MATPFTDLKVIDGNYVSIVCYSCYLEKSRLPVTTNSVFLSLDMEELYSSITFANMILTFQNKESWREV